MDPRNLVHNSKQYVIQVICSQLFVCHVLVGLAEQWPHPCYLQRKLLFSTATDGRIIVSGHFGTRGGSRDSPGDAASVVGVGLLLLDSVLHDSLVA